MKVGKKISFYFTFFALVLYCYNVDAQTVTRFPYEMDFTSGQPSGVITTSGSGTNVATFNSDGLLLTGVGQNLFGGVLFDAASFDSTNGLNIEFEYSIYGGTPYVSTSPSYSSYGDGLVMFLYDGTIAAPVLGSKGRGLGYAYNYATNTQKRQGLSGAYLGVGLDVFGNFKGSIVQSNPQEYLNGIATGNTITAGAVNGTWSNYGLSHVTLRGAYDRNNRNGQGVNFSGYPVLATQSTLAKLNQSGFTDARTFAGAALMSTTSGNYTTNANYLAAPFSLRGNSKNPPVTSPDYRKAFVTILPAPALLGLTNDGFVITVKIQAGNNAPVTVIDKYVYRQSITYVDNGKSSPSTYTLNSSVPSVFKLGFAASTGGASEAHLIKMVKISLPYMPETQEDVAKFCGNYNLSYEISPFDNDIFYNGLLSGLTDPTPGNTNGTHIDYSTFQFEDATGNVVGSTPTLLNPTATYAQANVGTWVYSSLTGKVTFTPVKNYVGVAETYYSAKGPLLSGMPYNQEKYRSKQTKITATVVSCNTISNPQLPSGRSK
ncbi:hypothetical protein H1R17_04005 [Flavobacterium sp. xlx-214]|uniref:hypothetical protein n=1 Tax=unclassified Flavobacterium TaxID=196869 RepID=UPI0013D29620|nr:MULTISPECIES: hypothetical protein [unclassified Flavobacterium]MBA5792056.1 hypothetical protein [Flavobacterium sp. xlx-221]QMI84305.1 hypothetical protein H1R17_04005 [Flavobacterium sp. xlx-214]